MKSLKSRIEGIARKAGVNLRPVEEWGEKEWQPIINALEGGAAEVRVGGIRFTRAWYLEFVRAWDAYRAAENAAGCDEIAALADARGFTSLAGACREQAADWRAKAAELEKPAAG